MFPQFAILAFATLALATGAPPASQCQTAPVQCCNSVEAAGAPGVSALLATVGVVLQDVNIPIGITCTPISVVGVGSGASCNSQAVCCDNNSFHGIVAIGCTPVNIAL